ncbi:MAG: 50S ribosomal protein L6 [candidate division Zixibacteria bacterium]|nr:50S ribosomal protein L6 [candidate division Zixibacteria bacterium]
MSRIGKLPVAVPTGVSVNIAGTEVSVKGPKGSLTRSFRPEVSVEQSDGKLVVRRNGESRLHKSLHGLSRALLANMVTGVFKEFSKVLLIVGVGYRAEASGKLVSFSLGYSHPILIRPPEGIKITVENQTRVVVSGVDRELVGEVAAKIRGLRPPEPYKGKGIQYEGEKIRRKAGKTAA